MRSTWVIAVAASAAMMVAACGEENVECGNLPPGGATTPLAASASTVLACADPHSTQHIEADETYVEVALGQFGSLRGMADLVDDRSDHRDIIDLAEEIADAVDDHLVVLEGFEDDWDLPEVLYNQAPASYPATLPEMEPDPAWEQLRTLDGDEFDALWVDMMLRHLASAGSSAQQVIQDGRHAQLRALALEVTDQVEEWTSELEAIQKY